MPFPPYVTRLTVAELYERADAYLDQARSATTADIRGALTRLAQRYAMLAAERRAEEKKASG